MNATITVKCSNGFTLHAAGQTLVIAKKREEETVPVSRIQSFTIKEPRGIGFGKIIFTTAQAPSAGVNIGLGVGLAIGAEKTFFYSGDEAENARALRDFVSRGGDAAQSEAAAPAAVPAGEGKTVVSVVEEIRGLKGLLDDGILTQEEFDAKKKQLLGL